MIHEVNLLQPEYDGDVWHVQGTPETVVMKDRYPVEQYWLPFGVSVFFRSPKPSSYTAPLPLNAREREALVKKMKRKLTPQHEDALPYIPEFGVEQYPLPFPSIQMPTKSMVKRLRNANFPLFDKIDNKVLHAKFVGLRNNNSGNLHSDANVRAWVRDYCMGRVCLGANAIFEKLDDYTLALTSGLFQKLDH